MAQLPAQLPQPPRDTLSVTALYTSDVWRRAGFAGAELYATRTARDVRRVVDLVLWLARLFVRGAPSLHAALVHRHAYIDHVVAAAHPTLVLELACGLSRRGAAISANPSVTVVEVDLPEVVAYKEALLAASEAGRSVLARPNLRRVGADLTRVPLAQVAQADRPAAVVIEGLLMYLSPEAQTALWSQVAAWLRPHGGLLVFDLLPGPEHPQAGWVGRLLGRWMERFTGGKGFARDTRDRAALVDAVRAAGFPEVEAVSPAEVAVALGLPMAGERSDQCVFVARVPPGGPA